MCGIRVAAEGSADAVEFISGNSSADPTTANQYSDLSGAILHRLADLFRVVRIIVRNRAVVRAEVDHIVPRLTQLLDDPFIERVTTMICSDCNTHKQLLPQRSTKRSFNFVIFCASLWLTLNQPPGVLHHIINIKSQIFKRDISRRRSPKAIQTN